ncbi:MAG TPA: hydroxyquinol 1,2-dioxygenase [Actinomycetota bacterium]|nr:hydroxyquinol 1,2-dioxygenase [Actinomycetota bacterium]
MTKYVTRFGSLDHFEKGGVEIINDDPKHYAFSNIFEVASRSKPYDKVAVGKNMQYVLEVIRAEGTSEWRAAAHDEFALVMDGLVEVRLVKLADPSAVPARTEGSIRLPGQPAGRKMGVIRARRGHMMLLAAGAAYQFHADRPGVVLLQTIASADTQYRWADICQTM